MKKVTKSLIIFCCVSLCVGGAILSAKDNTKSNPARTKVHPINNQAKQNRIWLWS